MAAYRQTEDGKRVLLHKTGRPDIAPMRAKAEAQRQAAAPAEQTNKQKQKGGRN